jgi:hypothetical protein
MNCQKKHKVHDGEISRQSENKTLVIFFKYKPL